LLNTILRHPPRLSLTPSSDIPLPIEKTIPECPRVIHKVLKQGYPDVEPAEEKLGK